MYLILKAISALTLGESVALIALFFESPFQYLILIPLDAIQRGRFTLLLRAILISLLAIFLFSVYNSFVIIRRHGLNFEPAHWASRVDLTLHILQALLAGLSIFIACMIKKTYNLLKENQSLGEIIKAEEKKLEDMKKRMARQRFTLSRDVNALNKMIKNLEFHSQAEAKRVEAANARALASKNRLDELRCKYEKLLEYNQTIQNQLQCIDLDIEDDNDLDDEMLNVLSQAEATDCRRRYLFPDFHSLPSPRHRRPIYQCR